MPVGETGVPRENLTLSTIFVHHKLQLDPPGFEPELPAWKANILDI